MTNINKDQLNIKQKLRELLERGVKTELPNLLQLDQMDEILTLEKYLLSQTTQSRRVGKFFQIGDYFYYFSNENETIPDILSKLEIKDVKLESLSKLMVKLNSQLHSSDGEKKWFSKQDSTYYTRIKNLNLKVDSLLILPLAVPDPYHPVKRPAIPSSLRQLVWEQHFHDKASGTCYVCSKRIRNENNGWHCAHIIPYIICQCHELKNLRVSCPTCNLRCGTLNFDEFKMMSFST